jgi:uncharacterized membrane protein
VRLAVRFLDALGLGLGLASVAVMVSGGATLGGVPLTRPEAFVVATALVVGCRAWLVPYTLPGVRPWWAVGVGIALYVGLMSFIVLTRHFALRTHAWDLGDYVQIVWSIAQGHGAHATLLPYHPWGDHLSPILYLLAPLAWFVPVAPLLLVTQTVVLALGALAVFRLARASLDDPRPATALALLYLTNPTLHGINLRDFHPQAFVIPLVLAAALALDRGRPGACGLALALALACREDATLAVMGFGLWVALARRRAALGAGLIAVAIVILAIDLRWIIPAFRGHSYQLNFRFAYLGVSNAEIAWNLLFEPWRWMAVVFTPGKVVYVAALLAPFAFLPLLAPRVLAGALPGLALNLLAGLPAASHHRAQYQFLVLPFLVLAAIEGWRVWRERIRTVPHRRLSAAAPLAAAAVLSTVLTSRTLNDLAVTAWRQGPAQQAAHRLLAVIPPDAPVSANERLVPHLATRREVFIFPADLARSAWIIELEHEIRGAAARTVAEEFTVVTRAEGWVLARRQPPSPR